MLFVIQLQATEGKLLEIRQNILEGIQQTCRSCDLETSEIQDGEFSCPNGADSSDVLYRAKLISSGLGSCDEMLTAVTNWIQSSSQASLMFQSGNLLVAQNCAVEIDSFQSELDCPVPTLPTTDVGGVRTAASNNSLPVIGGVAGVAVGIVIIALLVIVIAAVVIVRKKRQKR